MEKSSLQQVIELSGLPQDGARDFLREAFVERGLTLENADLNDLRNVLADLLQDLILSTADPSGH